MQNLRGRFKVKTTIYLWKFPWCFLVNWKFIENQQNMFSFEKIREKSNFFVKGGRVTFQQTTTLLEKTHAAA